MVRIPQITSLETAIEIFYSRTELSNADIKKLFGNLGSATVAKMKKVVLKKQVEKNIPIYNDRCINTDIAFTVWGLDINDLERRMKKLKQLL